MNAILNKIKTNQIITIISKLAINISPIPSFLSVFSMSSFHGFWFVINPLENRVKTLSFFRHSRMSPQLRHSRNSLSGIQVKKGNGKSGFPTETFGNDALDATLENRHLARHSGMTHWTRRSRIGTWRDTREYALGVIFGNDALGATLPQLID
jgi:hypothetical protein